MRKLYIILFFMPIFLFGQSTTVKTITIEPYMSKENYEHFKRLVLESSDSKVNYINGFDFEWGYYYTLKVEENYLGQMSEGTNYEYSLIKIISKEKVNDTLVFQLFIDPLRYYQILQEDYVNNYTLNQLNDSTFLYLDNVEIEIPQKYLDIFKKNTDNKIGFLGNFKFINANRIRLLSFKYKSQL